MARHVVLLANTDFDLVGRPILEGDQIVIRPGFYVKHLHDLSREENEALAAAEAQGFLEVESDNPLKLVR
ncbi:MAG: hypothetical protein ACT4PM_02470 [Gemmatimonadales bacterium]